MIRVLVLVVVFFFLFWLVQMLVVLWMTRSITDDVPGWGALFHGRAGDGTVSVSSHFP